MPYWPQVSQRVADLLGKMTLEEKLAQIVSFWPDQGGNVVAPMQGEMATGSAGRTLPEITEHGLGQYTRVYGTRPVEPAARAAWLWDEQRRLKRDTRLGIPALVHEEVLTGVAAWQAATFPAPLAWGATFDPDLVYEMGHLIGQSMKQMGVHLGLAPVLDVIRDPRWGRTEEAISEDPYVVGTIGTKYVQGMQAAGVDATLKHFVGYSGTKAGRNHAPLEAGPRQIADIYLPPFEMAVLDGNVRSVMASYNEIDGIPSHINSELLSDILRGEWGFTGTVVADYFGVAFLNVMHGVAGDRADAAAQALMAGLDVELPGMDAYPLLVEKVADGSLDERYIDRAVLRHLAQKEALGLLDETVYEDEPPAVIDLDTPEHRSVAAKLAEESIVLLSNLPTSNGNPVLPLFGANQLNPAKIALIGPNADSREALQGCYSFANHILAHFPDTPWGFDIPTVKEGLEHASGPHHPQIVEAFGCEVEGDDRSGFAAAVAAAAEAQVAIVVVGDRAGLFGRGTVGEGNDAESLELPGVQRELVEAIVATGTPTVMVLLVGRPYLLDWALPSGNPLLTSEEKAAENARKPAAVLFCPFPGEEGGNAIADIIYGNINPSGRLPLSLPRSAGAQPYSYLHPMLGGASDVTSTDSTPTRPFGFGLSYTDFAYSDLVVTNPQVAAGRSFQVEVTVTNTGERTGTDVVQLYGRDLIGATPRPMVALLGYQRVFLQPGESKRLSFDVPTTRFAFTDRSLQRVVEPGEVELWVASHSGVPAGGFEDVRATTGGAITNKKRAVKAILPGTTTPRVRLNITGDLHKVTTADKRWVTATVSGG
ncbi:MAG: glycoside hydrolase family 3 C-terminal domain-containing protein [Cellulomonadaceae bacterium]|nr:glycoside hydrolase family 3 C-terminal domain-containing protein [Cellulomonadaceae bacterium]